MKIIVCLNFRKSIITEEKNSMVQSNNRTSFLDNECRAIIEQALELKKQEGGKVILMAAGTDTDCILMREGLAMGCDEAHLIVRNQRHSAGTVMLSVDMVNLILRFGYDLVITGYRIRSGFSSFLGAELAELLQTEQLSLAKKLKAEGQFIRTEISYDREIVCIKSPLPCVVTLDNSKAKNEAISVMQIHEAIDKTLKIWKDEELDSLETCYDRNYSNAVLQSVIVKEYHKPKKVKKCELYDEISVEEAVDVILEKWQEQKIVGEVCV